MIPNDTLPYPQIKATLRRHQRSFLLQQTGSSTETHAWTRVRDFGAVGCLHQTLSLVAQRPMQKRKWKELTTDSRHKYFPELMHIRTHRDCGSRTKISAKVQARWGPSTKKEEETQHLTPNQEADCIGSCRKNESQFSPVGCCWLYHSYPRIGPTSRVVD